MANLPPGQTPGYGAGSSTPRVTSAYSGTGDGQDPTTEPGQYPGSIFGTQLPQGTGAPGSQGATATAGVDPTLEPGQLNEGISGLGPADTANTGAPGSQGATNSAGDGPDSVSYTRPGSYLSGTYATDTVHDSVSGPNDWTQSHDGSYGGGPQLPGIDGNMPSGTGAGGGRVMRGGRAQG